MKVTDGARSRGLGRTWLIVVAMVAVPVLAWFYFIPIAAVCLVAACVIGTVGGAARDARARARTQRQLQVQSAAVTVDDYGRPMS